MAPPTTTHAATRAAAALHFKEVILRLAPSIRSIRLKAMASPVSAASGEPTLPRRTMRGGVEDRYRSLLLIGRGGMGTVEVALERREEEGFERIVALKRLLPEASSDARRKEMFLREARLAALLAHPNVVHVYAFGELHGELFMAMEYLEGEPLSHLLRAVRDSNQALAPTLVAFILAQVCDGLHAAHELRDDGGRGQPLNVVHRDVSPHNVMIAYDGQIKLLDFGVAKFEAAGHESRTGEVKGKMAYMSPEQALGEGLDRRSDLFSVGAVLFECLTGERMWGTGTDLEVMRRLALEDPPTLDEVMPNAPRRLVDLHKRLVARELAQRPATAHDIAEELRAFAASALPAATADAVRGLMRDLFGAQAAERRAILTESLQNAAPAHVAELQRSFEATVLAYSPTTSTEPLIVGSSPMRTSRHRVSSNAIVAGSLAALLGAIAVSLTVTREPSHSAPRRVAPGTSNAMAMSHATPTATATATPTSSTTARATPLPSATVAASALPSPAVVPSLPSAASARTPTPAPASMTRPHASAEVPGPVVPIKLPDVDPTPF
jgi:eukaryotic-like serine/threonine-protein kinase